MQTSGNISSRANWPKRVGWLLLLWLTSVGALGVLALTIRVLMHWAGMRSS